MIAIVLSCVCAYAQIDTNIVPIDTGSLSNAAPPLPNAPDATVSDSVGKVANTWLLLLIPVLTPMLVRLGKFLLPKIPTWTLPIIAPALVATANWLSMVAGGPSVSPMLALALGAAGTGIREIKDQVQGRITEGPPPKVPLILIAFLVGIFTLMGCVTGKRLEEGGAYAAYPATASQAAKAAEPVLFTFDSTFDLIYTGLNTIFENERNNRLAYWAISPEIKKGLDAIRPGAKKAKKDYALAREAYIANPGTNTTSQLEAALGELVRLNNAAIAVNIKNLNKGQ